MKKKKITYQQSLSQKDQEKLAKDQTLFREWADNPFNRANIDHYAKTLGNFKVPFRIKETLEFPDENVSLSFLKITWITSEQEDLALLHKLYQKTKQV